MYPQDGGGWQSSRPQDPRGPNPDSYPDYHDSNPPLHQVSAFQPNSAAFEYMRSLDSQSGGGGQTPPRQRDYPPQRGQSPPPSEHSPTPGRHTRTPRRMRRTTRATGAASQVASDGPAPPGPTPRIVSDTPMNMPSNRPILMTGPANDEHLQSSRGATTGASMPGVGVGIYDDDPMSSRPPQNVAFSGPPLDSGQTEPPSGLPRDQSDGSYIPAAPYQNMMQNYNTPNQTDPTVERARNLMASRTDNNDVAGSRPMPFSGRPVPPETPPLEPPLPQAQLRRRILTNKPKREPDLVRGKVVKQMTQSSKKSHVLCAGCGVMLQISKTAVVVHCRNCNGVHPTASCRLPNSR